MTRGIPDSLKPKSIKSLDSLYKLSEILYKIRKIKNAIKHNGCYSVLNQQKEVEKMYAANAGQLDEERQKDLQREQEAFEAAWRVSSKLSRYLSSRLIVVMDELDEYISKMMDTDGYIDEKELDEIGKKVNQLFRT